MHACRMLVSMKYFSICGLCGSINIKEGDSWLCRIRIRMKESPTEGGLPRVIGWEGADEKERMTGQGYIHQRIRRIKNRRKMQHNLMFNASADPDI